MSVQLIVFPQYFDGSGALSSPSTEFFVDGIDFNLVNTSSSTLNITGALPQAFINSYTLGGITFFITNTWYRFSSSASPVVQGNTTILFQQNTGILQRLSNLTFGATYDLTLDIGGNTTSFTVYQYHNNILRSSHIITGAGTQTIQFDAYSTADTIVIYSGSSSVIINSISCVLSTSTPSGVFTDLSNGQVICDLYEDEDIPLSLSVDDFKNVAEKVQSYSKAFNLPATKRNNQIFDNIFEVTRTDTGLNFNPYKRTKAILKQDGFLLFEGYLRLIDIQDKEAEISYNVNLYSEVVALADVLGDRTFSDLDFTELTHDYNITNIKATWGATGVTYLNSNTSGFRAADTVKYPFCNWNSQYTFDASSGFPILPNLESAFRPFLNIKYLIDRIFAATDFTYQSTFFDTADFEGLYMDFNWGADSEVIEGNGNNFLGTVTSTTAFQNLRLDAPSFSNDFGYDDTNHRFVAPQNNTGYIISTYFYNVTINSTDVFTFRWAHLDASGNVLNIYNQASASQSGTFVNAAGNNIVANLQQNETLQFQFKTNVAGTGTQRTASNIAQAEVIAFTGMTTATSDTLLQKLRGELGQWDFLKGLMTMFNLVSLPDENNPSNIKIEPYRDIFISSGDAANPNFFDDNSTELNWTEKIDVSETKLTPLTELNKKTIFKFVEDDEDYAFNQYKFDVQGHLYGSKKYDASGFTILAGEDEVVAEPFAATVIKPLDDQFADFITPAIYSMNDDGTSEGFENSPRIMYNNGKKTLTSCTYSIPEQNGGSAIASEDEFLQFSHIKDGGVSISNYADFHFGECQLIPNIASTLNNLFNLYWLPYYSELYNPDARTMTIKVNLSPSDINTFRFFDIVMIKNRTYRVNKIDYKPNDLATVEFILLP